MNFAITKMSTKGQIVIPTKLREEFSPGDEFLVVKEKGNLILKRVSDLAQNLKEDLEFAKRTEAAIQEYKKGRFKSLSKEAFLEDLEKW